MWNNFCAVVEDLFWFAWEAIFGTVAPAPSVLKVHELPEPIKPLAISSEMKSDIETTSSAITEIESKVEIESKMGTAVTAAKQQPPAAELSQRSNYSHEILHAPILMYVVNVDGADCLNLPQQDFDCVIDTLPYGTALTVIGYSGQYASVNRSNITGWVRKDDIAPNRASAWPTFTVGHVYDCDNAETKKAREIIGDMFYAGKLNLPLQAGEYIMVKLESEHRSILWPRRRPRVAGMWQQLLRGVHGIHMGITPKTDSVMEWSTDEGEGRLAYVESVTPDKTLILSAVGFGTVGQYVSKTLTVEEWKELRPVFIEVI